MYTAIWQSPNPHQRQWIEDVMGPYIGEHVTDGKHELVLDNCILLDAFVYCFDPAYYARFRGKNAFLVHFLDENYEGGYDLYRNFRGVFRNFWSGVFNERLLLKLPLGYQNGMRRGQRHIERATRRKYIWSFVGQAGKSSRPDAVRALAALEPHFMFSTDHVAGMRFISGIEGKPRRLPASESSQVLLDSIFAPCPMGNINIECYRVYESLECGAIPILEKRLTLDYYRELLGDHPMPTVRSWSEARRLVSRLLQRPEQIDRLQEDCMRWWSEYKVRYTQEVGQFLEQRSRAPQEDLDPLTSSLARMPGWKIAEVLRHHDARAMMRRVGKQVHRLATQGKLRVAHRPGIRLDQQQ